MLITKAYFIGEIDIPNTDYEENDSSVSRLIAIYENQYLDIALGLTLSSQFTAGLQASVIDAKWLALRDGVPLYTSIVNGRPFKWNGFVNSTTLLSPISYYCYYWYLRNQVSVTAEVGETESKTMNSDRVSSKRRQAEVWNMMVEQNWILFDYLRSNQDLYPDFDYYTTGISYKAISLLKKINQFNF